MAPSPQHSARKLSHSRLLLLALLCIVSTACGTIAPSDKVLFEDPRGTVSLRTISDRSIQASHPIDLNPDLIARVLSGMQVQKVEGLLDALASGEPLIHVFSEEEVEFLAPRIAKALTTAATGEAVAFLVTSPHPGKGSRGYMDTTAGSLYAYDLSLNVTLSQYRYDPIRAHLDLTSQANTRRVDVSGLRYRTLLFTPSEAQRVENVHRPTGGAITDRFLAIDYQLLPQASPAVATTGQTAPQPGTGAPDASSQTTEALAQREAEIQALKDRVNKNVSEVEALRKELESVQQQLGGQTTRQDSPKRKTAPPSKSQQTAP